MNLKQGFHTTNNTYLEQFNNNNEVVDHAGVKLSNNETLVHLVLREDGIDPSGSVGTTELEAAKVEAKEQFDAAAFLSGLNYQRYQTLVDELSNSFLNGRDKYPRLVVAAYKLVTNWKGLLAAPALKPNSGVTIAQAGNEQQEAQHTTTNATKGILKRRDGMPVVCKICSDNHYTNECPDKAPPQQNSTTSSNSSRKTTTKKDKDKTNKSDNDNEKQSTVSRNANTTTGQVNYSNVTDWDDNINYTSLIFCA